MIKKILFTLLVFISFISCNFVTKDDMVELVKIISPKDKGDYFEDELIFFTTNADSTKIEWSSSRDGILGNGNNINYFLSEGNHEIKCIIGNYEKKVIINVKKRSFQKGECVSYLLNDESQVFLYPGVYSPVVCCLDNKEQSMFLQKKDKSDSDLIKDISIENELRTRRLPRKSFRNAALREHYLGEKKNFYIVKTNNQMDEPYNKECVCIDIGKHYTAWVSTDDSYDLELLNECTKTFDDYIYTRLSTIWGDWADVDSDQKIALLFSSTINTEKYAIGFYNTNDLFANEQNNYSNQMDVLYLGIPEKNTSSSYSVSAITATIAHELTHAINFNQKSYKRILQGFEDIIQEEVFIDEAFSHLTESLCGYGVSGGNIDFVKYYLKNSGDYSLCGKSRYGEDDSAGRRGAMLMFMSWLFWKKGGLLWGEEPHVEIKDNGGITFLRELVESQNSSWENIGTVYGKPISQLFVEFVNEINLLQFYNTPAVSDPVTNEAVTFPLNMFELLNDSSVFHESLFEKSDYLQWSLSKVSDFTIETQGVYEIQTENRKNFILSLVKIE